MNIEGATGRLRAGRLKAVAKKFWIHTLAAVFFTAFLFPYLAILLRIDRWQSLSELEWLPVLLRTTGQAAASAFLSCVMGGIGAMGLLFPRPRLWLYVYLLPNTAPVLFIILGMMNLMNPFPMGMGSVVFIHVLLNTGVVAVMLREVLVARVSTMGELAMVEGAGRWQFLLAVLPYLKKDIIWAFLFVFSLCFSSFTVPLVVGGYRGSTIEVLIYEQINQEGAWGNALMLSLIQMLCVLFLAFLLRARASVRASTTAGIPLLASIWGRTIPTLGAVAVIVGCGIGLEEGWQQLQSIPFFGRVLVRAVASTTVIAVTSGTIALFSLSLLAYTLPHRFLASWMRGYVAPSAVIIAFAFLSIGATGTSGPVLIWIGLAVVLLFLPTLYRLGWASAFESLESQRMVALTLGAGRSLIFRKVIMPQIWPISCFLSGLLALWSCGDIAVSGILMGGDGTVALIIESLLGSYRLEGATVLVWLMMALGLIIFFLFWSLRNVLGQQSSR